MHWTAHVEGGLRRVNHAAIGHGDLIFTFGGFCSGDDYTSHRPIDVHVLNTRSLRVNYLLIYISIIVDTLRWHLIDEPQPGTEQYRQCPSRRYGHTAVKYNDCVYI